MSIARRSRSLTRRLKTDDWDPQLEDSWRDAGVARQMLELTDRQLDHPEGVRPYQAFLELLPPLLEDEALANPATVLDIGCGVGAYGELLERVAPDRFRYLGADYAGEIVAAARARWPGRRFEQRDLFAPGALEGFDVLLASALVDVLRNVETALERLLAADARWLIIHRQRIDKRRTHVEVVPGYRGQQTYSSYITLERLDQLAAAAGRELSRSAHVEADIHSFLFVRP
jgi:SAM-dependent methyltransferase